MFSQLSGTSFSIITILLALLPIITLGWLYLKHTRSTCCRCSICDKEFEDSTALLSHYKTMHNELLDHMLSSHIVTNDKKIDYYKDEAQKTSKKVV